MIARILSGGQSGADRAALDWAIAKGVPWGGWCPAGGWAEDLTEPPGLLARYPRLRETPSPDPAERTRCNVRDSDLTLAVGPVAGSPGTALTAAAAEEMGRPLVLARGRGDAEAVEELAAHVTHRQGDVTLNVAGPRSSEDPDVYDRTWRLLDHLHGRGLFADETG